MTIFLADVTINCTAAFDTTREPDGSMHLPSGYMFGFDGIKAQPRARTLRAFTTCPSLETGVFNDIAALRVA